MTIYNIPEKEDELNNKLPSVSYLLDLIKILEDELIKHENSTTAHTEYVGQKITSEGVLCKDKEGNEVLVPGKTVICALGQRANRADVEALRGCAPFVSEVGDCVRPANITKAIYEAYHAALDI